MRIFSIGDCPVCADSGAVVLLKPQSAGPLFYFCPLCGVAWAEPPEYPRLDSISTLAEFAPNGALLPSAEEAARTGVELRELPYERWFPLLRDSLESQGM
jgi:hypothetical protein